MRNTTKFVITIILVAVISMIYEPGVAASILTKISVELNTLTVKINEKTLTKDNIIYNGNVYLRADKLSDLLGKKLEWNKKSKIITISDKVTSKTTNTRDLVEIAQTSEKSDKVVSSLNLFDKDKSIYNMYVDATNGNLVTSTTKNASDYCIVKPKTSYIITSVKDYAFYDLNKTFISGNTLASGETNYQITTPSNTKYIRFSYYNKEIKDALLMLTEGTKVPTRYIPYTYNLTGLRVTVDNLDFPYAKEGSILKNTVYWSDITFVNGEIWAFTESDTETGIGTITIYNKDNVQYNQLTHNFGHCNTVDYCEGTDTLIFGNGGGFYNTNGYINIIQGVSPWRNLDYNTMLDMTAGIPGSDITTISVARAFGDKVNVCWGEDNNTQHNICYVLSNDNQTFNKLLLGMGTNKFESGQFVAGKTATQFNGTFKILGTWTTARIDVNQGCCYYNGYIYSALGHTGLWSARYKLKSGGTIDVVTKQEKYYAADGSLADVGSEGLTVRDGMIYHATKNSVNAVHVYRAY